MRSIASGQRTASDNPWVATSKLLPAIVACGHRKSPLQLTSIAPPPSIEQPTLVTISPRYAAALTLVSLICLTSSAFGVDFVHEVMPVLKKHCGECHTGQRKEGGLTMNSRAQLLRGGENGAAAVPGNAAKSLLMQRIRAADEDVRMPPEGPRLSAKEMAALNAWIQAGLPWEPGVSLGNSAWEPPLKPREVTLPPAHAGREHPIDRLLDADLARNQQQIPGPISDAAFLRRVSLDAVGLLPTPDVLQAFLADQTTNKRQQFIDRLLADDVAYADHWLTTWNDLLRNDYTGTGFITRGRTQITGWLYSALRENQPYDQMVRALIAPTEPSAGFINGIKWRGEVNASQTREIQFAQNISQVFLGINMKCASCHDSFIDRWKLAEAYNLAAIYSDHPLELNRCDKPTGQMATPKWIFPEIGDVDPQASKEVRLQQLSKLMTHPQNGRFTRTVVNRLWHRLMGRGIVHPVDAMHTKPWNEDLLDYLAVRFANDGYDLRKFIRFVMTSQAYQSQTAILKSDPGEDYVYAGPLAKRMTAEQFLDAIWQITETHPTKPTANVDRAPRVVATPAASPDLPQLPISAKWIWHDGQGSSKCELKTNFQLQEVPQLASVLATCDNAFTMKVNGQTVATSKNWQTPLQFEITKHLVVGDNQLEVAGEMFGGAAGFICQIVMVQGKTRQVITTDRKWQVRKPKGQWQPAQELHPHGGGPWGAILSSKAVQRANGPTSGPPVRAALMQNDFLMRSLGRPHRDQVVTTRPAELTTLQAIDLANGDILAKYLAQGSQNVVGQKRSGEALIDWLYRFALSRAPTVEEQAVLTEVVGDAQQPIAVEDLLWMVFMQPEFQIIR